MNESAFGEGSNENTFGVKLNENAVGVLGGSFDPVHNAHLAMAAAALEHLRLDRIVWIPSGTPPHRAAPLASPAQRVEMLKCATAAEPRYLLDEREIRKTTPGYTVETLESLRAELGASADIVLLIGADQHARLETWHRWRDLFDLARIAVFARPGLEPSAYTKHVTTVPMPALDISSSEIRKRLANGESARGLLPDSVLDYIDRENLYRRKPTSSMEGQTR